MLRATLARPSTDPRIRRRDAEALPLLKRAQDGFVVSTADAGANRHRGPGGASNPNSSALARRTRTCEGISSSVSITVLGIGRFRDASDALHAHGAPKNAAPAAYSVGTARARSRYSFLISQEVSAISVQP